MLLDHAQLAERAARIRLAVFDVDGVMSDGRLYYTEAGTEFKAFYAQDGLGLKHLMKAGVEVAVITGRDSPIVSHRMKSLGISRVFQGREDKREAFDTLLNDFGLSPDQSLYAGDDLIDLPLLNRAGLAVSVPNGHPAVKQRVHWVTPRSGGEGAVRDICDLLLESRDRLKSLIDDYQAP